MTLFCPLMRKKRYGKHASRQRPNNTANLSRAPKVERKDQHPGPEIGAEPHHGHQVAIPHHDCRCAHGSDEAQKHRSLACRRGSNRGVQAKDAFATGRCEGLAYARASPSSAAPACIAACSGMASRGCQRAISKPVQGASLRQPQSVMCTLTLPSCAWPKASSTCSWPLTGFPRLLMSSSGVTWER